MRQVKTNKMALSPGNVVNNRRTRVKVSRPKTEKPPEVIPPPVEPKEIILEDPKPEIEDSSSDEEGTRTYEINKPALSEVEIEENGDQSDDGGSVADELVLEVSPEKTTPVPAPRLKRTETVQEEQLEITKPEEEEEETIEEEPPKPLPRNKRMSEEGDLNQEEKKLIGDRKRKSKASEIVANVLNWDIKKLPIIATIAQSVEEEQKGKEEAGDDVGSPWDSPPAPQELSKVYVQHKHGFAVKDWGELFQPPDAKISERSRRLTNVAVAFHDLWSRLMMFSHGIVAGIACCHTLAVAAALASTDYDLAQFVQFYHFLSLKVHFLVYVFTTFCIVSCFDRLDIAQLGADHVRRMAHAPSNILITVGYLAAMMLGLAAHRHTAAIEAYKTDPTLWDSHGLHEWHWIVTFRDVLLVLMWITITLCPSNDLLKEKLVSFESHPSARGFWRLPFSSLKK